jgi:hypothetical protein
LGINLTKVEAPSDTQWRISDKVSSRWGVFLYYLLDNLSVIWYNIYD